MSAIARRPYELVSPQIGATTGREPYLPYESYLESLAVNVLPGVKEAEYEREKLEEEEEFNRQAREDARKDATRTLAIQGGSLAMEAKEYFPKLGKFFSGSKYTAGAADAAKTGLFAAKTVGLGTVGLAGLAGKAGGGRFTREIGKLGGLVEDKGTQEFIGGAVKGAVAGFVQTGFNPVGALVGALAGGAGAKCIIVTACSGRDSYDVGIAREFRNKYMDKYDLRGYYMIAELTVNIINRHKMVKSAVKYLLVDKLVDYGEWALGKKETEPRTFSIIVTKLFLGLCRLIGKRTPTVIRTKMEVI